VEEIVREMWRIFVREVLGSVREVQEEEYEDTLDNDDRNYDYCYNIQGYFIVI
jgi:hypothetical protein